MTETPTFDDPLDEGPSSDEIQKPSAADKEDAIPAEEPASTAADAESAAPAPQQPARPRKPWFDTYTAMLAFSLLAIIAACLFLAIELQRYNWEFEVPGQSRNTSPPAAVA